MSKKIYVGSDVVASTDAADIASGTFNAARIPNLDASKTTTGTFNVARIPNLSATKITSGTLDPARLPPIVAFSVATSNAIGINFSQDRIITRSASGNVSFTGSNYTAGKSATVRIVAGGANRNLTFPSTWKFVSFKPQNLQAGSTGILTVTSFGTSESEVVAAWAWSA
jgi:hypothetical protein